MNTTPKQQKAASDWIDEWNTDIQEQMAREQEFRDWMNAGMPRTEQAKANGWIASQKTGKETK